MDESDWKALRATLEEALERPGEEREPFVRARLGGRQELVRRALRLLAEDESAPEEPARIAPWAPAAAPALPARLGAWRIERELASGGMGTVLLAHRADEQFQMRAAVKVLRRGFADDEARRLFVRERQVLARLEHPGIARLLDGGETPEGAPFLVMELVDGVPIDRYCRERALGIRARVELFIAVCEAVEYLHRNLVVHRDLKPANVLVTADGQPKLLDFGIAKVLEDDADDAASRTARILTPGYASPEQVRGEAVTTATDVYSLGVVLYELLTGSRPYRVKSGALSELERAICETPPRRPSTACLEPGDPQRDGAAHPTSWARRLRGDLDGIVLEALRKEPEQRYPSVAALADDLRRHLAGLPVCARPESVSYRLSRFVARNRAAVAAATLFVVALVAGLAVSLALYFEQRAAWREAELQGGVAREQRDLAHVRFEELRDLSASFLLGLHDQLMNLEGSSESRRALVATSLEYLQRLAENEPADTALALAMARAYRRIGLTQGDPHWESLGEYEAALENLLEARRRLGLLAADAPGDAAVLHERAHVERNLGDLYEWLGRRAEALSAFERARALGGELEAARGPAAAGAVLGPTLRRLAVLYADRGQLDAAREAREAILDLYATAGTPDPRASAEELEQHAVARLVRAEGLAQAGAHDEAVALLRETLRALERSDAAGTLKLRIRRAQALALFGASLTATGAHDEAEAALDEALAEREAMRRLDPESLYSREALAGVHETRGALFLATDRVAEGLDELARGLELREELADEHPAVARLRRKLAERHDALGTALRRAGAHEEALLHHRAALPLYEALAAADAQSTDARRDLSVCLYAEAFAHVGLHEERARPLEERAAHLRRARECVGRSHELLVALEDQRRLAPEDAVWIERMAATLAHFDETLAGYRDQGLGD